MSRASLIDPIDDVSFAIVLELKDGAAPSAREDEVCFASLFKSDFLIGILGASALDTCKYAGYNARHIRQGRTSYDSSGEYRYN